MTTQSSPALSSAPAPEAAPQARKRQPIPTNITMVEDHGETGPAITCQGCGAHITDYRRAGVAWTYSKRKRSGFRIYCKGENTPQCLWNHARREPFMELSQFLGYLLHNAGLRTVGQFKAMRESIERGF